jgi:L-gulonolactone oxidase
MMLDEICDALAEAGLALPFVPTIGDITAAGATATNSHGADRLDGNFGNLVQSLRLVDGLGRDILINWEGCFHVPDAGPMQSLIACGDPLSLARAHLGLLGAVHELTLRCVPAFDLAFEQVAASESAGFGTGYAKLRQLMDSHEHADFFWFRPWARVLTRAFDATTRPRAPRGWVARRVIDGLLRTRIGSAAKPHPGKLYFLNPFNRLPLQRQQAFLALKRELDPRGVFTNSSMREYLAGTPDLGPFMHTRKGR